ncbi:MAG: HDOD domain-containing protein [Alphaproteobacteria bacterium]|jgi:DNA-binding NarL/FixJ family response regulator
MKPVVMFVDDELRALTGLERDLHKMRTKWDMLFYASPVEALDHMADGPIDLVVSDLRMPVMDGASFLNRVAVQTPNAIRFIASDERDRSGALDLIGVCHQVLSKPYDADLLIKQAQRALASRRLLPDNELKSKVTDIRELPSRPEVHELIIAELRSEQPSYDTVAALIAEDLALSAKVLQIAASCFFRTDGVPNLSDAVNLLGMPRIGAVVRNHALEAENAPKIHDSFSLEGLWLHSLACANIS